MNRFAWNGISLQPSGNWEVAALEKHSVAFEHEGHIVSEWKWSHITGSFSFEKHIKRIAKEARTASVYGVEAEDTPLAWQAALATLKDAGFSARSFMWESELSDERGLGVALFSSQTKLAVLAQFFVFSAEDEERAAAIVATARDERRKKFTPWQVFGITAELPHEYVLDTFHFKPGFFSLRFWKAMGKYSPVGKGRGHFVTLERCAPASILLEDVSFENWVRTRYKEYLLPKDRTLLSLHSNGCSWRCTPKNSTFRRLVRRVEWAQGSVWQPTDSNVILSFLASGMYPIDPQLFSKLCAHYDII